MNALLNGIPARNRRQLQLLKSIAYTLATLAIAAVVFWAASGFAQVVGATPPGPMVEVPAAPSLFAQLNITHVLEGIGLAVLVWIYKDLNPFIKAKLAGVQGDPKASPVAHTAASIGLVIDSLVESAAGHALPDIQAAVAAGKDPQEVFSGAAADLVDGLGSSVKTAASQYLGTAGGAFVDYIEGLIKSKVQAAQAAGAVAAAAVKTPALAAVAIDAATPAKSA